MSRLGHPCLLAGAFACLPLSLDARAAEPPDGWLRDQMKHAYEACHESKIKVGESQRLVERALALSAKAPPKDMAGRGVARQAEFKARSALAKNKAWNERACARARTLDQQLSVLPKGNDWSLPVYVRGDVKVDTGHGLKRWDGKTPLQPGQTLKTGKDGYAEMVFPDGAELRVGPNTEFTVEKELPIFKNGSFYYARAKHDLEEFKEALLHRRFAVRTPTAVLAVRGTKFALVVDPKGPSRLALMEGEAAIIDTKSGTETVVHAGQQVEFQDANILRGPEPLDPKSFQEAVQP